jgi:TPR repeat protein
MNKILQKIGLICLLLNFCLYQNILRGDDYIDELRCTKTQLKDLASQGNAKAQFWLGMAYLNGLYGYEINEYTAYKWIHDSAQQGLCRAVVHLAMCYRFGKGVDKNEEQAVKWYHKASKHTCDDAGFAQEKLSFYYINGGFDPSHTSKNILNHVEGIAWLLVNERNKNHHRLSSLMDYKNSEMLLTAAEVRSVFLKKNIISDNAICDDFLNQSTIGKYPRGKRVKSNENVVIPTPQNETPLKDPSKSKYHIDNL